MDKGSERVFSVVTVELSVLLVGTLYLSVCAFAWVRGSRICAASAIFTHMYMYMYTYTYTYTYIFMHMHIYMYMNMYMYTHVVD